ncbi:unnamed protein product [Allacma fusca]|uniref:Dymeclin n=1 Tax=Allacma fusca TaxID=39272 RepID=A0A8J2K1Z4_9HEXA|nr:unnamed protein product [Allacma fusca]
MGIISPSPGKFRNYWQLQIPATSVSVTVPIYTEVFNNSGLYSLPLILTKDQGFMLDANVEHLRADLFANNKETRNFASLIQVFTRRAIELNSSVQTCDSMFIWQAYNALFIIRTIIKYFAEYSKDDVFARQFSAFTPSASSNEIQGGILQDGQMISPGDTDVLDPLVDALMQILSELPVKSNTYLLHLEAVNTLIVLLSTQMFCSVPAYKLLSFRSIMQRDPPGLAACLTKTLLNNYMDHKIPPTSLWQNQDSGSLVIGMASGIWNILRKGVGFEKPKDSLEPLKENNLASHSLSLLLILINHCTSGQPGHCMNPYRESVVTFENENADDALSNETPMFKLNYGRLYDTICREITTDDTTLLLYMLIHRNSSFKSYIMARSDIEQLVLPILLTLYHAPTSTSHHIYMSLIVLLILSEDELFNQQVHDIVLRNVTWYTERSVNDITLGGLIILVVIRTIQYNILKMRDKYLHTNCLAALANMSSKFRSLHPYVAQRLISLFETLAKRHNKLMQRFNQQAEVTDVKQESEKASETVQDITVLEEVIRMVLEILNSVLTHQLQQNRHLIYTLLYKKTVFDSFRNYDATQDLVANIDIVINYFSKRLTSEHHDLSSSEVMERVEDGVLHWSPDILRKFPDLKFRYVEEDQPEEFFIPYIWSLIYHRSGIHWSTLNISLFNAETDYALSTKNC